MIAWAEGCRVAIPLERTGKVARGHRLSCVQDAVDYVHILVDDAGTVTALPAVPGNFPIAARLSLAERMAQVIYTASYPYGELFQTFAAVLCSDFAFPRGDGISHTSP